MKFRNFFHPVCSLFLLICSCAAFLPALSADENAETTVQVPDIEFQEPRHNFGDVGPDSVLTHVFRFSNKGNADLTIVDLKAG